MVGAGWRPDGPEALCSCAQLTSCTSLPDGMGPMFRYLRQTRQPGRGLACRPQLSVPDRPGTLHSALAKIFRAVSVVVSVPVPLPLRCRPRRSAREQPACAGGAGWKRSTSFWEEEQRHGNRWRGGTNGTPDAIMSCIAVDGGPADVCANCGKGSGGEGGVKLKDCTACRLVKYCGVDCQRAHRKQHKKACKQRAAELKDEQLYGQGHERPEGHFCPICTLPISLPMEDHSVFNACCMKLICNGCAMAAKKRGMFDCTGGKEGSRGEQSSRGKILPWTSWTAKGHAKAVELWTEAAELGSVQALFHLGFAYYTGEGVQKDVAKAAEFYKKAAMQGHVLSRTKLGCVEVSDRGNYDRAVRHFMISAKMGLEDSVESIKWAFMAGLATKEQYAEALKGYQNAVEEMKSHDRDEASALMKS
ncbi:hypothetical protein THAOC_00092 [Thalassiosira oceanica]|uniref:MYND-type domain-containing protein n=1 Tax=Thalassiosira oceanica TaxID=159749 RepID=K3W4J2_THAOC|nr:hypothetical protein THAOC_00092 [Thalassiosira oceanica]|eukprot:EJK78034.1 hypothetical protein THAOC_00092 [Thalassiosira oceanica]